MNVSDIIMAVSGIVVGVVGTISTRIGKKGDQTLQAAKEQFDRMLGEINYYRDALDETRTQWEGRWDRQMARCRKVTDQASVAIARLMNGQHTHRDHEVAEQALRDIEEHVQTDHTD